MYIGMFTDTYRPQINGVVTTIDAWKERLEELGHEVLVVHPDAPDYDAGGYALPSVDLPYYEGYQIARPGREIPEELEELDIVHTHTPFSVGAYGAYVAAKLDVPRVTTHHTPVEKYADYAPLEMFRDRLVDLYLKWERKYMEKASVVTAPTPQAAGSLGEKIDREVKVLSNGVDVRRFRRKGRERFREEHGLEGTVIGFCGRHSYEKRLEDLIELAERTDATILLGGDGPAREDYEERAAGLDNVRFLGIIPDEDMPAFYSALDAFVLPSIAETQGLVVMESNACGTPAVGARAAALTDTIEEGVNGYLYEPGDIDELEEKINLVLDNKGELEESSREMAEERSVERSIEELLAIYEEAEPAEETKRDEYLYRMPIALSYMLYKIYG